VGNGQHSCCTLDGVGSGLSSEYSSLLGERRKREKERADQVDAFVWFLIFFSARSVGQEGTIGEVVFLEVCGCGGCCYWDVSSDRREERGREGGREERESVARADLEFRSARVLFQCRHHDVEEEVYFPSLELKIDMAANIEQHSSVSSPPSSFSSCFSDVRFLTRLLLSLFCSSVS